MRAHAAVALLSATAVVGDSFTPVHEAGRCAIRGACGKKSFFGPELPCVDNGPAEAPSDELRSQLVELCGPKWESGDVCCTDKQVAALEKNLQQANPIISACPACKDNFYNLFCTFTCSPDQSLFVNVTRAATVAQGERVAELDHLVSDKYGAGFYDSCKDVKFGPTNGNAMDFIGGGAKNYTAFLAFLGHESLLGSPFQINFPRPSAYPEDEMKAQKMTPRQCNDEDPNFRCACVDCPAVCPALPEIEHKGACHVGLLPCLSFGAILVYGVFILLIATAIVGHIAYAKHKKSRSERLQLLQDSAPSDDEDNDIIHASTLERPSKQFWINTMCDKGFSRLGYFAATFPGLTIGTSIFLVGLLSLGWINFSLELSPERLWVSPSSAAAQEKNFFDSSFGPFYRAEQVFLVNDTTPGGPGPVLSYDTLKWWFDVEERVTKLTGLETGVTLNDVCFNPTGDACVVQSVTGYFGGDADMLDPHTWKQDLASCTATPVGCRPPFGLPLDPKMVLGGWEKDPLTASAMIVSWVVSNYQEGTNEVARAMDWESSMVDFLRQLQAEATERGLRVSFSTEISLEAELNQSTNTDAKIVVISYIIMFIYASVALGSTTITLQTLLRNPGTALVQSKFTLGVVGILIVLMSISASVGLFSAAGVKATLIIAEVIPFIVLAVGVDNIFLIVHEFERVNISHADEPVEERVARALGRMGPSILLSATTETIAFALGAAVGMPAVRNFAIYAAGAVFINALLQVTMFIAVLALNQRRVEDHRADCVPCVQIKSAGIQLGREPLGSARVFETVEEGFLQGFIRQVYAPALLGRKVRTVVVMVFFGLFAAGVSLLPEITLGLDQRVAIPDGSYLIPYFNDLYDYFDAGPPVYFVTRGVNVTERAHQQQLCSRFTTCEQDSITNVLEVERKRSNESYIGAPTASWIDDYFRWLNPEFGCCVEGGDQCFADRDPAWNITLYGMPEGDEFIHYLEKWLKTPANEDCPLGGEAAYGTAIVVDSNNTMIPASHFRTSHTPLRSQEDFIAAYASARRIANHISASTGVEVFPYSIFYIFFDQYATIVSLTATLIGTALALILLITSVLLGSLLTGFVVTLTVGMTVIDIMGTMAVAKVSLNAVSLVNLVICVGIAVEFCAHVARAFMFPPHSVVERVSRGTSLRSREVRAQAALVHVGASVFSGITITKFVGVCVLAFTSSKIFDIYYFRIWLALVIFAALHALIFLPVALSFLGGEGYDAADDVGGIENDLAHRRHRALVPDEYDWDSDDDGY